MSNPRFPVSFLIPWTGHNRAVLARMIAFHEAACLDSNNAFKALSDLEAERADHRDFEKSTTANLAKNALRIAGHDDLFSMKKTRAELWTRHPLGLVVSNTADGLLIQSDPDLDKAHPVLRPRIDEIIAIIHGAMCELRITDPVCLEWSCDQGGGGAIVRHGKIDKMTTAGWLQEQTANMALRIKSGIDIDPDDPIWADVSLLCTAIETYESDAVDLHQFRDIEELAGNHGRDLDELQNITKEQVWPIILELAKAVRASVPEVDDRPGAGATDSLYHFEICDRVIAFAQVRIPAPATPSM